MTSSWRRRWLGAAALCLLFVLGAVAIRLRRLESESVTKSFEKMPPPASPKVEPLHPETPRPSEPSAASPAPLPNPTSSAESEMIPSPETTTQQKKLAERPKTTEPPQSAESAKDPKAEIPLDAYVRTWDSPSRVACPASPTPASSSGVSKASDGTFPPADEPKGSVSNAATVVAGRRASFRRCYQTILDRKPNAAGAVRLKLHIDCQGGVESIRAVATIDEEVTQCVIKEASQARFAPPTGGSAIIDLPVTFIKN